MDDMIMERLDFLKFKPRQFTMSPFKIRGTQLSWQSKVFPNRVYFHAPFPTVKTKNIFPRSFPEIKATDEMNVLEYIHPSETEHSRIICELLDPKGRHCKGDLFLFLFFECLGLKFNSNDTWVVTAEKERYDIRIRNSDNSCIIIIENKSNWATDRPNQLYRYWYYGIRSKQRGLEKMGKDKPIVKEIYYLSPNEFKSPTAQSLERPVGFSDNLPDTMPLQWKPIFFGKEIVSWLDKCLSAVENNTKLENNTNVYFYIKQYLSFWRGKMSTELVVQATEFFKDDKEQWNSFLDLHASKDAIRNSWFIKLKEKMNEAFAKNNLADKWSYHAWNTWDYRWYLSDFGRESVCIWLLDSHWHYSLNLYANQNEYDTSLLSNLLQQEKYSPIVSCFERMDELNSNQWLITEKGNYSFGSPHDGHFNADRLAWFANFETDKLVAQIAQKVDRFRRDAVVTGLLAELSKETKITNG